MGGKEVGKRSQQKHNVPALSSIMATPLHNSSRALSAGDLLLMFVRLVTSAQTSEGMEDAAVPRARPLRRIWDCSPLMVEAHSSSSGV